MRVLVVPEHPSRDQHLLQPIVAALFREAGCPSARVRVCLEPVPGSVEQALLWERIAEVLEINRGMVDLFLLLVDRDGKPGRRQSLNGIEAQASDKLPPGRALMAENAWQAVEAWALVGADLPRGWTPRAIRNEVNVKETYFAPYVRQRELSNHPAEGRALLGREAARRIKRLCQLCPEDLGALLRRIRDWLAVTS